MLERRSAVGLSKNGLDKPPRHPRARSRQAVEATCHRDAMLELTRNDLFGFPLFILRGDLGFYNCASLLGALQGAIDEGHRRIGLDLSRLDSLDCSGASLIQTVSRWLAGTSRRLTLLGISRPAARALSDA